MRHKRYDPWGVGEALQNIQNAWAQVVNHNHTENKAEVLDEAAQREAMLETARAMGADDYLLGGPER